MINIRIGGVPEHFNLPIHLAMERGDFERAGIHLDWINYPGGSGHMTNALRQDEVDVCVVLTEGIVTDIINGNPSKIISEYVITPLTWGIHTGMSNPLTNANDIFDKQHAISRLGSGSHLMAIVHANTKGHSIAPEQFDTIDDLNGAIDSLTRLKTDVFYWEKYTTKPYVDEGKIRRIGEYVSPWSCFVIAASSRILETYPSEIDIMLDVINASCQGFMSDKRAVELVSERYQIKLTDAARWYHSTEWASNSWVSDKMLKSVVYHLQMAGILEEDQRIPELIWKR
jgi:hypothetical protein